MALFDDEILFELVPEHVSLQGNKVLRKTLLEFMNWVEDGRKELLRTCEQGRCVWNERIDHWKIDGRWIAISTPRSGWYGCVAERGTGTVAFLELADCTAGAE